MTYTNKKVHGLIRATACITAILLFLLIPGTAFARGLLREGSRGPEVTRVQQELKNRGYFNHWRVTDYFGPITRNAVLAFQRSNRLMVDGIVGPQTRGALFGSSSAAPAAARSSLSQRQRDNIFWLARIIHAEARGESYRGQVAVGNVVMNRVRSTLFPNSVYGVIFEYTGRVPQFSPVQDGSIHNTPYASAMRAAEEAYFGARPVANALYFFNPSKAAGTWIVNNRRYMMTIGRHAFYH